MQIEKVKISYRSIYNSPLGSIKLISDGEFLTHLMLEGQNRYLEEFMNSTSKELDIFIETKEWLDDYFSGKIPNKRLNIKLDGTEFQKEVWNILLTIPYGEVMTYGEISNILAGKRNLLRMSSQAVGNAVSKNPISIIVPCHRVLGVKNKLVGYQGGLELKKKLLELEKSCLDEDNIWNK